MNDFYKSFYDFVARRCAELTDNYELGSAMRISLSDYGKWNKQFIQEQEELNGKEKTKIQ